VSRWRRTKTVATFEFLTTVKRRGYLITTFGMPIFIAIYAAVLGLPAYFMTKQASKPSIYGVVDPGGVLRLKEEATAGSDQIPEELRRALETSGQQATIERMIGAARTRFRPYANEAEAEPRSSLTRSRAISCCRPTICRRVESKRTGLTPDACRATKGAARSSPCSASTCSRDALTAPPRHASSILSPARTGLP